MSEFEIDRLIDEVLDKEGKALSINELEDWMFDAYIKFGELTRAFKQFRNSNTEKHFIIQEAALLMAHWTRLGLLGFAIKGRQYSVDELRSWVWGGNKVSQGSSLESLFQIEAELSLTIRPLLEKNMRSLQSADYRAVRLLFYSYELVYRLDPSCLKGGES